ncbi:MAG: RagB/SusD family nutrient uptake outer membrane protein [Paludibacter sp.]
MKTKYIFQFIITALLLSVTGCNDDLALTSSKPSLQVPSEALMNGLLTTAYSTLTTDRSTYGYGLWGAINGCDTDESFYKTTNNSDVNTTGLHNCNSTTTTIIQESWRAFYEIIESCNIVIDMAKTVQMNETTKADMVGQAMSLRAFAHFMLAVHFGPVPIRDIPVHLMTNLDLPRDPIKNVCAFAVKDLRAAVPMLEEIKTRNTTTYITKSVAEGLSLRVGLYMASHPDIKDISMYDSVAVWGKQLIESNAHDLNTGAFSIVGGYGIPEQLPGYAQVFINNMQNNVSISNNREAMWDCSFFMKSNLAGPYASWNGAYVNWLGSYIGVDCADPSYGTSRIGNSSPQFRPQATLWNKYETGDLRRDWNIATYAYKNTNNQRYNYLLITMPATIGTPTTPAKLRFIVKGEKLADETVIENGGAGYKDATYTDLKVEGYSNKWETPAVSTGSGTKFTVVVSGGTITSVKMLGASASGYMNVYSRGIGKWRREYEINYTSPREQYNGSCNFPILRYADVFLMTAEAALLKKGTQGASVSDGLGYLNKIRYRAFGKLANISSYDLAYIQDERSRELCFEGLRRMDLMRWGYDKYKAVYDKVVEDTKVYGSDGAASPAYKNDAGINASGNNEPKPIYAIKALMNNYVKYSLMPIPNAEIGRASNTFYQNQGW